jgi:hypothetical protein
MPADNMPRPHGAGGRFQEFTLDEAIEIAKRNDPGEKVPSVSRTLIAEIVRLRAEVAGMRPQHGIDGCRTCEAAVITDDALVKAVRYGGAPTGEYSLVWDRFLGDVMDYLWRFCGASSRQYQVAQHFAADRSNAYAELARVKSGVKRLRTQDFCNAKARMARTEGVRSALAPVREEEVNIAKQAFVKADPYFSPSGKAVRAMLEAFVAARSSESGV